MILKVMDEVKNHFIRSVELQEFEITANSIVGEFSETYLAGMYVLIKGSYLNDGLYKIDAVSDNELTLEETLTPENTGESFLIYACTPPNDFVELVTEIENHNESIGIKSESQGKRSITYADDGVWQTAFKNKLGRYRKVFTDLKVPTNYKWQDRLS